MISAGLNNHTPPYVALRKLMNGFQVSQAIHVAATLGIADLMSEQPRSVTELAVATQTHPPSLYRLLRALASVGIFREEANRSFALTPMGACLRKDAAQPAGSWAAFIGRPEYREAWGQLLHSVRTGENAFRHVYGLSVWEYRERNPEAGAAFDQAMSAGSRATANAVIEACDFARSQCVVDVGGGQGVFVAVALVNYPSLRGIVFDQPHVVERAQHVLRDLGVDDRCRIVGGDFFKEVPTGGDAYVLRFILHDWEDKEAVAILKSCRRACGRGGRLLVIEREVGAPNEGADTKFSDLNMLVSPGGRERTREEWQTLFLQAGLSLRRSTPTEVSLSVLEATPS